MLMSSKGIAKSIICCCKIVESNRRVYSKSRIYRGV